MQHLSLFYLFITLLIGFVSLGIWVVDYFKHKTLLVRYYLYFYLSLTLMAAADLLLRYVVINLPGLPELVPDGLNYVRIFIADYAITITFAMLVHHVFQLQPQYARRANIFVGVISLLLCIGEHIAAFVYHTEFIEILGGGLDNVFVMLVFFYGGVLGISLLDRIREEHAKRFAKSIVILLMVAMPIIVIDMLLETLLTIPLYPIVYCATGLLFTYHLMKRPPALPQTTGVPQIASDNSERIDNTEALLNSPPIDIEPPSDVDPAPLLNDALYQQYQLSPREQDVLQELVRGASNKELSERLFISVSTIKTHLRNIYAKFDVKNRYELLALLKHGAETLIPWSKDDEGL